MHAGLLQADVARPAAEELAVFRQHSGGSDKTVFYQGKGCIDCNGTGYRGRTAIAELLDMSDRIREMILGSTTTQLIATSTLPVLLVR